MTTGRINQVTICNREFVLSRQPTSESSASRNWDARFPTLFFGNPVIIAHGHGQREPGIFCHVFLADPCTVHAYRSDPQSSRRNARKAHLGRKNPSVRSPLIVGQGPVCTTSIKIPLVTGGDNASGHDSCVSRKLRAKLPTFPSLSSIPSSIFPPPARAGLTRMTSTQVVSTACPLQYYRKSSQTRPPWGTLRKISKNPQNFFGEIQKSPPIER